MDYHIKDSLVDNYLDEDKFKSKNQESSNEKLVLFNDKLRDKRNSRFDLLVYGGSDVGAFENSNYSILSWLVTSNHNKSNNSINLNQVNHSKLPNTVNNHYIDNTNIILDYSAFFKLMGIVKMIFTEDLNQQSESQPLQLRLSCSFESNSKFSLHQKFLPQRNRTTIKVEINQTTKQGRMMRAIESFIQANITEIHQEIKSIKQNYEDETLSLKELDDYYMGKVDNLRNKMNYKVENMSVQYKF